jgi:hypothetical protein
VVDYTAEFEQYSYLWLDDMQEVLDQFLTYGRTLNSDELDTMGKVGEDGLPLLKETPPNNDAFRQKVTFFFFWTGGNLQKTPIAKPLQWGVWD